MNVARNRERTSPSRWKADISAAAMSASAAGSRDSWARNGSWGAHAARTRASPWAIHAASPASPPGTRAEPSGPVEGNEAIAFANSSHDYLFRELGITFLGRDDLRSRGPS